MHFSLHYLLVVHMYITLHIYLCTYVYVCTCINVCIILFLYIHEHYFASMCVIHSHMYAVYRLACVLYVDMMWSEDEMCIVCSVCVEYE